MNNIFDIKRFGNYFVYDLNNLRKRFGISAFILAAMPLILYFFIGVTRTLFEKTPWYVDPKVCAIFAILLSLGIVIISFPMKTYGFITERKAGSSWLLLPASTFEKFLSMVIISMILLPVVVIVGNYFSNALLSVLDKNYTNCLNVFFSPNIDWGDSSIRVAGNGLPFILISITQGILVFLLGALVFKKAKVAKTFLVSFGIGVLFMIVILLILKVLTGDFSLEFEDFVVDMNTFVTITNWAFTILFIFWYLILLGGIFWRLKTIKP